MPTHTRKENPDFVALAGANGLVFAGPFPDLHPNSMVDTYWTYGTATIFASYDDINNPLKLAALKTQAAGWDEKVTVMLAKMTAAIAAAGAGPYTYQDYLDLVHALTDSGTGIDEIAGMA